MTKPPAGTRAEQIYLALKRDLLGGRYRAGQALLTRELLARHDCGISPLREALARLVGEGMIVAEGHRGVRVPEPSVAELTDLYRMRLLLECEALRLSMAAGTPEWEARVRAAEAGLAAAAIPPPGETPAGRGDAVIAWERRHREFHTALIGNAPAPLLLQTIDSLVDRTERYRALRLVGGDVQAILAGSAAEHRALVIAVLGRDPGAVEMLRTHLDRTRAAVEDILHHMPAFARS
ncbi:GntR family transcriptional regulator [Paroceanicella profunda]|uniref:GntR family transcriptional regulator n=1 Tax=Paroceanicella profunda TaxID=2579971 RepID=UPI0014792016|nr:FCD domain-containing protein [Paroceanicella profunda]